MAHLYSNYTVPGPIVEQSPQLGLIVRCPNCASRFCVSFPDRFNNAPSTFIYPQSWPQNATYSHRPNFQYVQPVIHSPNPQNSVRRQYVSHHAVDMNGEVVHWIRDVLIDILNSAFCKYGVTISNLMVLLKQSCANYNIILPSSIMDDFEEFLRCEMADYVEIQDDLCRYHRPTLSVQEESISSSSTCGKIANHSKISSAALMKYDITPAAVANAGSSTDQVEKRKEMNETVLYGSTEESSFSLTKFRDYKSEQFFDGTEEHRRNDDTDKRIAADLVIPDDKKKIDVLHRRIGNDAISEHSYTKDDLIRIMEKWKKIFVGDIKELIRYLRMVDNYFQESDGKFTLSEFKEVFGELNKRWEFSDIDLVEMDIINVVHSLDKEHVLIVNPVVREMEFPEMVELARKIYNLLSKLLQSMDSVKVEVIVRTLNFGINDRKTIDEKYTLLWEVFSDLQFQDVFVVEVLQKQNKEHGFDIMVRLIPNLNLPRIFAE